MEMENLTMKIHWLLSVLGFKSHCDTLSIFIVHQQSHECLCRKIKKIVVTVVGLGIVIYKNNFRNKDDK